MPALDVLLQLALGREVLAGEVAAVVVLARHASSYDVRGLSFWSAADRYRRTNLSIDERVRPPMNVSTSWTTFRPDRI